jgi:hypothetical protein
MPLSADEEAERDPLDGSDMEGLNRWGPSDAAFRN